MNYINYDLYVGDEGVTIKLYTGITLTGATVTRFNVKKPDDTETTWTATIDGTDAQYMNHTLESGDIDSVGVYLIRAYVEKGTLKKPGHPVELKVRALWDNE